MSDIQPNPPSGAPAGHATSACTGAPPTAPGALAKPQRKSGWPTALGVIIIVFGAFALLGAVMGVIGSVFMRSFVADDPQAAGAMGAAMGPETIALNGVTALVAVLAVCAGASLVRRSARAPGLARLWAWAKIVTVVLAGAWTAWIQRQTFLSMAGSQGAAPGASGMFAEIVPLVTLAFTIAWGWALPIVTLCMLATKRARAEVATWASPPRANA